MSNIEQKITDFVSWDVENDYYNEEKKEKLAGLLKDILSEDEVTVRKFLEKFFSDAEVAAKEFGLLVKIGDAEETDTDETDEVPDETDEVPDEEKTNENFRNLYIKCAAEYLYE